MGGSLHWCNVCHFYLSNMTGAMCGAGHGIAQRPVAKQFQIIYFFFYLFFFKLNSILRHLKLIEVKLNLTDHYIKLYKTRFLRKCLKCTKLTGRDFFT